MDDDQKEVLEIGLKIASKPLTDIDSLLVKPAEQIGGTWTDALVARRQIRRVALAQKVQAVTDKAGFKPQQIPDKIGVPILREALLEDDESLQEIWADLLANAADPRQNNPVLPSFPQILKEFTSREAHFLDALYKQVSDSNNLRGRRYLDEGFTRDDLLEDYANAGLSRQHRLSGLSVAEFREGGDDLQSDLSEFAATIDVLKRNQILRESETPDPIDLSGVMKEFNQGRGRLPQSLKTTTTKRYYLTDLGTQFIKACRAPGSLHSSTKQDEGGVGHNP